MHRIGSLKTVSVRMDMPSDVAICGRLTDRKIHGRQSCGACDPAPDVKSQVTKESSPSPSVPPARLVVGRPTCTVHSPRKAPEIFRLFGHLKVPWCLPAPLGEGVFPLAILVDEPRESDMKRGQQGRGERLKKSSVSKGLGHLEEDEVGGRSGEILVRTPRSSLDGVDPSTVLGLQRSVGNDAVGHLMRRQAPPVQRDDSVIAVDLIEVPSRPLNISELVTDTFRTVRACLLNFNTALENFATRITAESGEEAAPKDPALFALSAVSRFALESVTGLLPGGSVANDLVGLARDISESVQEERARSAAATDRNAAADFVIGVRRRINTVRSNMEANMTEDVSAARRRYEAAETEGERDAIRFHYEFRNSRAKALVTGSMTESALFVRLTEAWINEAQGESGRPAQVVIKLDRSWTTREAYLDAPFGSRLADELEQQGGLDVMQLSVPRRIVWFPHYDDEGGGLVSCFANVDAEGGSASGIGYRGIQSQRYLQEFVDLLSSRPIPASTRVTGLRVGG